jgi:hypothetical protein
MTSILGTLLEDVCTVIIMSVWIFLSVINISDKRVEETKLHISCSILFSSKNRAVDEEM